VAPAARAQTPVHNPDAEPWVAKVAPDCGNGPDLELGDVVSVDIDRLRPWVDAGGKPWSLVLFLDSIPVTGVTPISVNDNRDGSYTLKFQLLHTVQNQQTWATLLTSCDCPLPLSVGMPNGVAFAANPSATLHLIRYSGPLMAGALCLFAALLVIFLWVAWRFPLLRDSDTEQTGQKRPWSLARCQSAVWFFITLGSWLVLLVITKHAGLIPDAILGLLGISAATGVSGAVVDASKRTANQTQLQELKTEQAKDQAALNAVPADAAERAGLQTKLDETTKQVASLEKSVQGAPSENFLVDILSDAGGISYYRFQIFAWTLVLALYFIWSVWWHLAMPDFSAQLLGLLGISSGTYLGFKIPETKS